MTYREAGSLYGVSRTTIGRHVSLARLAPDTQKVVAGLKTTTASEPIDRKKLEWVAEPVKWPEQRARFQKVMNEAFGAEPAPIAKTLAHAIKLRDDTRAKRITMKRVAAAREASVDELREYLGDCERARDRGEAPVHRPRAQPRRAAADVREAGRGAAPVHAGEDAAAGSGSGTAAFDSLSSRAGADAGAAGGPQHRLRDRAAGLWPGGSAPAAGPVTAAVAAQVASTSLLPSTKTAWGVRSSMPREPGEAGAPLASFFPILPHLRPAPQVAGASSVDRTTRKAARRDDDTLAGTTNHTACGQSATLVARVAAGGSTPPGWSRSSMSDAHRDPRLFGRSRSRHGVLSAGSHAIAAVYGGQASFASTSAAVSLVVGSRADGAGPHRGHAVVRAQPACGPQRRGGRRRPRRGHAYGRSHLNRDRASIRPSDGARWRLGVSPPEPATSLNTGITGTLGPLW
jgi:hypothetical protein